MTEAYVTMAATGGVIGAAALVAGSAVVVLLDARDRRRARALAELVEDDRRTPLAQHER